MGFRVLMYLKLILFEQILLILAYTTLAISYQISTNDIL